MLASASPARLGTLRSAGIDPVVHVSNVDEESLQEQNPQLDPKDLAQLLAKAKCEDVAKQFAQPNYLVIGCDSVFELNGQPLGKPENAEIARARWSEMMNATGTLHTGHYIVYTDPSGAQQTAAATASTDVTLGELSDAEMDAYLESGEPFNVAGGFTLDALGGAFVQEVHGDPSNVVGISLPTMRNLVTELGLNWTDLWNKN